MPSAGWSNIFLQMMAGDPIPLPVIGEGQLELPWMTQIELVSFSWDIKYKHEYKDRSDGGLLGAAAGMAAGAAGGMAAGAVGGQAGLAAAAVAAAVAAAAAQGTEKKGKVELGTIKMVKRFDIASARIQSCADLNIPIFSALISVLHIKEGGHSIHEPGFTLLATDGFIEKVDIDMEKVGNSGVEVIEKLELQFKNIVVAYSKRLLDHNVPMPPFKYESPPEPGPSLPSF